MKTILAAMFAVMIGLTFAGSTFAAEEKKMDAPAAAPAAGGEVKKDEGKKAKKEKKEKKEKKDEKKDDKK